MASLDNIVFGSSSQIWIYKVVFFGYFDFTFHAEDGELYGAMGTLFYAIMTLVYIVGACTGQFMNNEDQETANAVNDACVSSSSSCLGVVTMKH